MPKKIVALVVGLGLAFHFSLLLVDSGFFRETSNLGLSQCLEVVGMEGPEDFVIEKKTQTVFVSSDERLNGNLLSPRDGGIFKFDPETYEFKNLTPKLPFEFHPHGIDIWESETETIIYVVNHREALSTVEVFSWSGLELTHVKTIQDDLVINPNDIAVVGRDKFYLSHDHGSKNPILKKIEAYSRIGRGFVSSYRDGNFQVKASSISYANGLVLSPDSKRLYVASMLGKRIEVFAVKAEADLEPLETISMEVGPDNMALDEDGSLLVSGHSKLLKLQSHMKDHAQTSPFEIYRITGLETRPVQTKIIAGDGTGVSGVSVAFPLKDKLLLGTIFTNKLLVCPKP